MKKTILSIGFILMITFAYTQTSINKTKHANTEKNIAIDGYDPVAYFTQNKAIKGNKKFAVSVDGIIYYCSSQQNMNLNTVVGVPMQWVRKVLKLKLIQKPLKLKMASCICSITKHLQIPYRFGIKMKQILKPKQMKTGKLFFQNKTN